MGPTGLGHTFDRRNWSSEFAEFLIGPMGSDGSQATEVSLHECLPCLTACLLDCLLDGWRVVHVRESEPTTRLPAQHQPQHMGE